MPERARFRDLGAWWLAATLLAGAAVIEVRQFQALASPVPVHDDLPNLPVGALIDLVVQLQSLWGGVAVLVVLGLSALPYLLGLRGPRVALAYRTAAVSACALLIFVLAAFRYHVPQPGGWHWSGPWLVFGLAGLITGVSCLSILAVTWAVAMPIAVSRMLKSETTIDSDTAEG